MDTTSRAAQIVYNAANDLNFLDIAAISDAALTAAEYDSEIGDEIEDIISGIEFDAANIAEKMMELNPEVDRTALRVSQFCPYVWDPHDKDEAGINYWINRETYTIAIKNECELWIGYTWNPHTNSSVEN